MTAYILQVVMFQFLFLLVYEILLRKETFFTWNRWYLLVTAIVSLLLPMIKIEALSFVGAQESISGLTNIWLPEVFIGGAQETVSSLPAAANSPGGTGINWWLVIYSLGVCGSLYLLMKKYQNLQRLLRFKTISAEGGWKIIEVPNSNIACTFYNTIFLGNDLTEAERQQILSHELVHVKQKHSLDLVFFEMLKIIFWFNPLVYIYQNRIATLHEFIADAAVVKVTEKRNYYEQLLNSAFSTKNISFINQFFNQSLIKKRIIMLQKSRSKTIVKIKYLVLVPLMLVMLTYVACSDDKEVMEETTADMISLEDEALKAALWEEILEMEKNGATQTELAEAFFVEKDADILSKEGYYRMQTMIKLFFERAKERRIANGTYDPNKDEMHQKILQQTYAEYVEKQKNKASVNGNITGSSKGSVSSVPFAITDEVPTFPGCEDLGSNEERKDCISENIKDHVNKNFNTAMGKELGLTGLTRIITIFRITEDGTIADIRARAPHPALEEEARRVIAALPNMLPGKHKGEAVSVTYSLPISFVVNE